MKKIVTLVIALGLLSIYFYTDIFDSPVENNITIAILDVITPRHKKIDHVEAFTSGDIVEIYGRNFPSDPVVTMTPQPATVTDGDNRIIKIPAKNNGVRLDKFGKIENVEKITFVIPDSIQQGNFCTTKALWYTVSVSDSQEKLRSNTDELYFTYKTIYSPPSINSGSEVVIESAIYSVTSIDGGIMTLNDRNCKTWNVDYTKAATYLTSSTNTERPPIIYSFDEILKDWLLLEAGRSSSGPEQMYITGVAGSNGIINATKVVRRNQN